MRFAPFAFDSSSNMIGGPLNANILMTYNATGSTATKQTWDGTSGYTVTLNDVSTIFAVAAGFTCGFPVIGLCYTTGTTATYNPGGYQPNGATNGGSNKVFVQRRLRMSSSPSGTLNSCGCDLYINSVFITGSTNNTSQTIPVVGLGYLTQNFTFNNIVLNNGDTLDVRWVDNCLS